MEKLLTPEEKAAIRERAENHGDGTCICHDYLPRLLAEIARLEIETLAASIRYPLTDTLREREQEIARLEKDLSLLKMSLSAERQGR